MKPLLKNPCNTYVYEGKELIQKLLLTDLRPQNTIIDYDCEVRFWCHFCNTTDFI